MIRTGRPEKTLVLSKSRMRRIEVSFRIETVAINEGQRYRGGFVSGDGSGDFSNDIADNRLGQDAKQGARVQGRLLEEMGGEECTA